MKERIRKQWAKLTGKLWFRPSLMTAALAGVAFFAVELSRATQVGERVFWWQLFSGGPESARLILSTIATSLITITGVAFSVVIVALALASSQYSSRVLGNFMRDRATQLSLGLLSGVFAYCLIVLLHIGGDNQPEPFVPSMAVLLGLVLGIVAIGVFIYFVHHIASSIRATSIICAIQADTLGELRRVRRDRDRASSVGYGPVPPTALPHVVHATQSGYLSDVDIEGMLEAIQRGRLLVKMERAIGEFVLAGHSLLSYLGDKDLECETKLHSLCTFSFHRSISLDPLFGVRQLVDVALRALSPGINDVTTAVMCLDQLSVILTESIELTEPDIFYGEPQKGRFILRSVSFSTMLAEAVREISHSGRDHVRVLNRLVDLLVDLLSRVSGEKKNVLMLELPLLKESAIAGSLRPSERMLLMQRMSDL